MDKLDLYRKLVLIRKSEEKIIQHYFEDEMKTPMHMSMGGEAISVGVCAALDGRDKVFGTYRSHGIYLARTEDSDDFFAELFGKDTARLKGKGGSMHLCSPQHGFLGTSAIVASSIPVAMGAAFVERERQTNGVVAVFFGDGAVDEGSFWETLNASCAMQLPVLFVFEDNGYAVHAPKSDRQGYANLTQIVRQFDCHVAEEESTDTDVIYSLAQKAITQIRETKRPGFLSLKYYRYLEHVGILEDFKSGYRSRDEFEAWLGKDPVKTYRQKLISEGTAETTLFALESGVAEKIEKSFQLAKEAPFPKAEEIFNYVEARS